MKRYFSMRSFSIIKSSAMPVETFMGERIYNFRYSSFLSFCLSSYCAISCLAFSAASISLHLRLLSSNACYLLRFLSSTAIKTAGSHSSIWILALTTFAVANWLTYLFLRYISASCWFEIWIWERSG